LKVLIAFLLSIAVVAKVTFTTVSETVEDVNTGISSQLRGTETEVISLESNALQSNVDQSAGTWISAEFFEDDKCTQSKKTYSGAFHAKTNTCLYNDGGTSNIKYACNPVANTWTDSFYASTDISCALAPTTDSRPLDECLTSGTNHFKYSCTTDPTPWKSLNGVLELFFHTEAECINAVDEQVIQASDIPIVPIIIATGYEPKFGVSLEYTCHDSTAVKLSTMKGKKKYTKVISLGGCSQDQNSHYWTRGKCYAPKK